MASHLTVTTAANPGVSVKGLNAQSGASTGKDVFAALLGNAPPANEAAPASKTAPATSAPSAAAPADRGSDTDEKQDNAPDPVAVPVDAPIQPQQPVVDQTALAGIIDSLTALRAALQDGQLPSADDLAKLNEDLQALATALGLSLDQLPSMDELAAMANRPLPAGATLESQLIATLAPMAQGVLNDATNVANTDPALANQLKAIGDKLAALLNGLNSGAVDADALAALGAGDDKTLSPDLQAALARLVKPAPGTANAAPAPQEFTAPKLQTTEPVLTGKATDAATTAKPAGDTATTPPASDTASAAPKVDASAPRTGEGDKPRAAKPDAAAAAAKAAEAAANTQVPIQTATRVEATPGPRPVIAGYQTSQQQLNLPQIAFELVRQVSDGNSRFRMRLDPPELGRIDVRLDIDRSGQVTARLTVEKAETLDLMQRDQRALERALQQAGLDSSKTNLEFSLKQNPFSGGQQGQDQGRQSLFGGDSTAEAEEAPAPQITLYRAGLSASGVNIIA